MRCIYCKKIIWIPFFSICVHDKCLIKNLNYENKKFRKMLDIQVDRFLSRNDFQNRMRYLNKCIIEYRIKNV